MITLRPLSATTDRAEVARMMCRSADYFVMESGQPPDDTAVGEFFYDAPPDVPPEHLFPMAIDVGGQCAGITVFSRGFPETDDFYIHLLLIDPAQRGKQIGHHAVAAIDDLTRAQQGKAVFVAVYDTNPRALTFWQREGFIHTLTGPPQTIGTKTHRQLRLQRPIT